MEIQEPSDGRLLAGIDGGGTNTRAVITNSNFHILGEAFSGPSNPLRVGIDKAVQQVVRALDGACALAQTSRTEVAGIGIGLGGVRHQRHHGATTTALQHRLPATKVLLVPDAEIALTGATAGTPGVIVIAGTGSVACGINQHGEVAYSGGWGPAFGDEGSGYDIARRALMAAAAAFDGRGQPTKLSQAICQWFKVGNPMELLNIFYGHEHPFESPQIAPLAKLVALAAEEEDQVAKDILCEAGSELARAVIAVITRLHLEQEAFRVSYVGSVFQAGDHLLRPFWECVKMISPQALVSAPLFPPAIGAAMLAQRRFLNTHPERPES